MTSATRTHVRSALFSIPLFVLGMLVTFAVLAALASAAPSVEVSAIDAGVVDPSMAAETHIDGNGPQVAAPVDAVPALPDPVAEPAEAAGQVWALYKKGTLVPAIVLAVFFVLFAVRSKVEWLRTGNRAAVTAALLVAATMLAERAAAGATPNLSMVLGALMAGVLLYVRGDKAATP